MSFQNRWGLSAMAGPVFSWLHIHTVGDTWGCLSSTDRAFSCGLCLSRRSQRWRNSYVLEQVEIKFFLLNSFKRLRSVRKMLLSCLHRRSQLDGGFFDPNVAQSHSSQAGQMRKAALQGRLRCNAHQGRCSLWAAGRLQSETHGVIKI